MPGALSDTLVLNHGASGNLRAIEELLSLLWVDADGVGDQSPPVRACTGNLIVYLEREDDRHDIMQIVSEVVRVLPCRVILMFAYPDQPEKPIEVGVTAFCWLEGTRQEKICSEQIKITACGKKIEDLPGIVAPLLVSDLPVYLWWRDRFLAHQELFEKFENHIDHVIYEGLHWKDIRAKVRKVLEITQRLRGRVGVTNFNWSRLLPWQLRIAQYFDRGLYQKDLPDLCRVSIEYHTAQEQAEGRYFQALLLTGWLAGQLKWKLEGGRKEGTAVHYQFQKSGGKRVDVSIDHEVIATGKTKGIQEINFEFEHGGKKSGIRLNRDPENQLLYLCVTKEGACCFPQKVRHVSASFATLLLRAMDSNPAQNAVFDRAFSNAVELLEAVHP